MQKMKEEEEKGVYLQAPTSTPLAFALLLPPRWSFWQQVALLKLSALEALGYLVLLKLWATQILSRSEALVMEVSAKGGEWGRGPAGWGDVGGW